MFIINREAGAGPVQKASACSTLQQKNLRLQHLLNHKAFLVGPKTGHLHCKRLRAHEASFFKGRNVSPHFLHTEDAGEKDRIPSLFPFNPLPPWHSPRLFRDP